MSGAVVSKDRIIFQLKQAFDNGDADEFSKTYGKYLSDRYIKCVLEGDLEGIKELVEFGLYIDYSELGGMTPLMVAAKECRLDAVLWLLDRGANVNVQSAYNGMTALGYVVDYFCHDYDPMHRKTGAGLSTRSERAIDIVNALMAKQPDLSLKNQHGMTVLEQFEESLFSQEMKDFVKSSYEQYRLVSQIQSGEPSPKAIIF